MRKGLEERGGGDRIENGIDSWRADETDIRESEDRLKLDKGSSGQIQISMQLEAC